MTSPTTPASAAAILSHGIIPHAKPPPSKAPSPAVVVKERDHLDLSSKEWTEARARLDRYLSLPVTVPLKFFPPWWQSTYPTRVTFKVSDLVAYLNTVLVNGHNSHFCSSGILPQHSVYLGGGAASDVMRTTKRGLQLASDPSQGAHKR